MEITRLRASLGRHKRIALDTCIFIYQWEAHPRYWRLSDEVFSSLEKSSFVAVTSTVTMTELLVHPYQQGVAKADDLFGLFSTYPNLEWVSPNLEIAAIGAQIRAIHRLHTPDALQAATALHANATAFITNDPIFKRVPGFDVLILDDWL